MLRKPRRLNALACFVLLLAACSSPNSTPTPTPTPTLERTVPVTIVPTTAAAILTPIPLQTQTARGTVIALPLVSSVATPAIPTQPVQPAQPTRPTIPPTETPEPLPKISLANQGVNVADTNNAKALEPFGFGWIQVFLPPEYPVPPYKILYRVPLDKATSGQPEDINAWADGLENLARERRGLIQAYQIGNEVNLSREWNNQPPDPLLYAKLLAVAYARIKTADPNALVIAGGIAPTGGDGPGAMDDLKYARAMFEAGAASTMDAYGFHPYGFAYEPERDPNDAQTKGLLFRRAEVHRKLMEEFGAGDKQMWATEFGWIANPQEEGLNCSWPALDWQRVSRNKQAAYAIRAYDYAQKNWPWMGPMFLWNYDFSRSPLYPDPCEQMKWFSMLDEQGNERPLMRRLRTATSS